MSWLSRKVYNWSVKTQKHEIDEFVAKLSSVDGSELAIVVAVATDMRHAFIADTGIDLAYPALALQQDPYICMRLNSMIRQFQKEKHFIAVTGLSVWIHSVRAIQSIELRQRGRDMWRELERGFPYALDACWDLYEATGKKILMDGFDSFPDGLTPDPL
ncbi:hypothetical protein FS782_13735 [Agrobacterium vitis]|uniref:hypothetical protein n=1 Tax=Agrobacterium vitis TaxID=373 RepID=UPI001F34BB4A|nr:hypothetical protein [Agrobacterium vitis]MCF1478132.1 hypothetical protein [Agrobacterium vitis]